MPHASSEHESDSSRVGTQLAHPFPSQQPLLDAIDDHAAIVSANGEIVAVNSAWRQFAVENDLATPHSGVGTNYLAVCRHAPPKSVAHKIGRAIERVLAGDAFAEDHEYPCHSQHEKRWFIARVGPLVLDGVTYALVTHQNVTRLKLIEHDVRTIAEGVSTSVGEGFFHSLALCLRESLAVDAVIIDELRGPHARSLAASGFAESLAGTEVDLSSTRWPDILAPNAPTELSLTAADEIAHDPRLAPWAPNELLALPIMGTDAAPVGIVAAIHRDGIPRPAHAADVMRIFATRVAAEIERLRADTCLHEREKELRRSEQRYRRLVQQSPDTIAIVANGLLEYLNPQGVAMLGLDSDRDAIGKPLALYCVPEDMATLSRLCQTSGQAPATTPTTLRFVSAAGIDINVEVATSTINYHGSRATQLFIRDVTTRFEADARARESQKLDAIGQLAAGVAHEVNNVLTTLGGQLAASQRAVDRGDSTGASIHLAQIRELASHTQSLTRSLLTYARKTPARKSPCDLAQAVEDSIKLLMPALPRTVTLDVRTRTNAVVLADPIQIQQIVTNLVLNARDAFAGRPGRVSVAIDQSDGFGSLTVSDNGPGMPESVRQRAFEPFYSTKPSGAGTGLGLSVVFGIVREHNGDIEIESSDSPPTGTRFTARFPLAEPSQTEGEDRAKSNGRRATRCGSILLVEDNAMVRRLAAEVMRNAGHEVLEIGDGRRASELLAEQPAGFDLVVMDLNLPGLDGLDAIASGRRSGYLGPVILSTGSAHIDPSSLPERVALLAKPYETCQLEAAIQDALHSADLRGTSRHDLGRDQRNAGA